MLTIACREDGVENFPASWRVEIDFARHALRFTARAKAYPKRIEVAIEVTTSDTWQPIAQWESQLRTLVDRTAHQGSRGFSHPPYQVVMEDRTVDLHGDGLITFLMDHHVRIPMRFIIKRLGLLKRFAKDRSSHGEIQ